MNLESFKKNIMDSVRAVSQSRGIEIGEKETSEIADFLLGSPSRLSKAFEQNTDGSSPSSFNEAIEVVANNLKPLSKITGMGLSEKELKDLAKSFLYFPRKTRVMTAYLHPFRMIESERLDPCNITMDEVNNLSYDYIKLHEIADGLDVGLESPYYMLVCRDGAIALPPLPELSEHRIAVEYINKCFAALLIGGVYCEAISLGNIEFGSILDWKYIRVFPDSKMMPNRVRNLLRLQKAMPFEAIELHNPIKINFTIQALRF